MPDVAYRQEASEAAAAGRLAGELAQLAQDVGTARDLPGVFDALRAYALSVTGGNALFVSLLDSSRKERRCVFAWADGEEVDVTALPPMPMSGGPHARAVATGEVVVVRNLQATMAKTPNVRVGYDLDPRAPRISIALPLAVLGRIIGGFEIQIIEHEDPWACVPELQVAANLAAVAIENVRLLEGERVARANAEVLQQRFGLLAEVSANLAGSLDDAAALTSITRLLVPRLADCCCIDIDSELGELGAFAIEHVDPAKREAALTLARRYASSPATHREIREVVRKGNPLLLHLDARRWAARARDAEHLQLLRTVRPGSVIIVPLRSRGAVVGTITLIRAESGRRYDIGDVVLAENLANRAASAIDNARLYRETRRAEDDLRRLNEQLEDRVRDRTTQLARTVEQLRGLADVIRAINSNVNLEDVLAAIVARAVQLSGADDGIVYELDPADRRLLYRASHGLTGRDAEYLSRLSWHAEDSTVVGLVARSEQAVQVADLQALTAVELHKWADRGLLHLSRRAAVRTLLALPLRRENQLAGVLIIRCKSPGAFPPGVVELMETFAAQSTVAMQNARLFQQLQQKSQDLEIASKHKSEFLASISHELRTPLNAIIGFAEVLLDHSPEIADDQRLRYLEHIERSGKQLLKLINDILDLSKVEAGRMELFPERVLVREVIDGCVVVIRVVALRKQISIETQVDPQDAVIVADPARLRQIVYNLLSNAVKFTLPGGWVRITARVEGNVAVIAVTDNGIGIKPEDQLHIFEEFRQANSGGTGTLEEGSGLGLSLVRKLAELHGGAVNLESTPGRGSCFRVSLPAAGPGGETQTRTVSVSGELIKRYRKAVLTRRHS